MDAFEIIALPETEIAPDVFILVTLESKIMTPLPVVDTVKPNIAPRVPDDPILFLKVTFAFSALTVSALTAEA